MSQARAISVQTVHRMPQRLGCQNGCHGLGRSILLACGGVECFDSLSTLTGPTTSSASTTSGGDLARHVSFDSLAVAGVDPGGSLSDLHCGLCHQEHVEWPLPAVGLPVLPAGFLYQDVVFGLEVMERSCGGHW